jgi:enoyl-CoA hydratase/carnithine racemase
VAEASEAPVVLEATRGRTRIITINRPEVRNAINADTARTLADAMLRADARSGPSC